MVALFPVPSGLRPHFNVETRPELRAPRFLAIARRESRDQSRWRRVYQEITLIIFFGGIESACIAGARKSAPQAA
jgi:hypothetical protein